MATKRTRTWESCVASLLSEPTIDQAAARAGVSVRALKNYLNDPDFLHLYRSARRQLFEGSIVRLQQLCLAAVSALNRAVHCGDTRLEIRAAEAILSHAAGGLETFDLVDKIAQLEQQLTEVLAHAHNGRAQATGRPLNGAAAPGGPGRGGP